MALQVRTDLNPRYVQYARAHHHSPDEQLEIDKAALPGACMLEFVLWNTARWRDWHRVRGVIDGVWINNDMQADYDAWLVQWVSDHAADATADAA